MEEHIRQVFITLFKSNPRLLSIRFAYRGRKSRGEITRVTATDLSGFPIDLKALRFSGSLETSEALDDAAFQLVDALTPGWMVGLGSYGTAIIACKGGRIRLRHTTRVVEHITKVIESSAA